MQRREFIGLIGAATASFPRLGHAETKTNLPIVGLLLNFKPDTTIAKERITALRKGLQEAGFIEGTNYSLAVRFAEGDLSRWPQLAKELAALKPRVIVTAGYIAGAYVNGAVLQFAPDLPLVFTNIAADPIALGWVQSYAHPGGMLTGNVMNAVGGEETMTQKRLGLFRQLVPGLTRLGMIALPSGAVAIKEKEALQSAAAQFDFEFVPYDLNTVDDLESAFAAGLRDDVSAFHISGEPRLFANLPRVMSFVMASKSPVSALTRTGDAPGF